MPSLRFARVLKGPTTPLQVLIGRKVSHVPMILASGPLAEPDRWKEIFSALDAFGARSGLFSKVEVRRLG